MWPFKKKQNEKSSQPEGFQLLKNQYAETPIAAGDYPRCKCFAEYYAREARLDSVESDDEYEKLESQQIVWSESKFHVDDNYKSKRAWDIACEIFDNAAKRGYKELNLGKVMDRVDYMALNTLPESIGELKDLEELTLYGSNLLCIPRGIAECENLRLFRPYTSYWLHWFPYEIKRCRRLSVSSVSTRALYGNYKMRPPFPDLAAVQYKWSVGMSLCSVCSRETDQLEQYWTSQVVATDVLPLLVSVCSDTCRDRIGKGAKGYLSSCHKGGLSLEQPHAD